MNEKVQRNKRVYLVQVLKVSNGLAGEDTVLQECGSTTGKDKYWSQVRESGNRERIRSSGPENFYVRDKSCAGFAPTVFSSKMMLESSIAKQLNFHHGPSSLCA